MFIISNVTLSINSDDDVIIFLCIFSRLWLKNEIKTLHSLLVDLIKAFITRAKV